MNNLKWEYVSPIKNNAIENFKSMYNVDIPADLFNVIKLNNGGMPSLSAIDNLQGKAYVFGGLLSFNDGDDDSVYDFIDMFVDENNKLKMLPFGLDPFGNFYCIKENKVVFYNAEEDTTELMAETFTDFLNALYEK